MRLTFATLFAVLVGFAASTLSYAQDLNIPQFPEKKSQPEKEASRFRPGVQGGLTISDYSSNPDRNPDTRVGFIGGFELETRLNSLWFVQPEVRFVQKGFSYNLNVGGTVTNFDARVLYLEVPVLIKAKFYSGYMIQPFVFAGPNIGFDIGSNVDVTVGQTYIGGPPLSVEFKAVDFSIDSGAGAEYHFAQRMAGFAEFRASIGLFNVSDLSGTNWKSRNYQIIFGGLFDL